MHARSFLHDSLHNFFFDFVKFFKNPTTAFFSRCSRLVGEDQTQAVLGEAPFSHLGRNCGFPRQSRPAVERECRHQKVKGDCNCVDDVVWLALGEGVCVLVANYCDQRRAACDVLQIAVRSKLCVRQGLSLIHI